MGVTRFIVTGVGRDDKGGVQRWAYDNDLKTFSYESAFCSTTPQGLAFVTAAQTGTWNRPLKDLDGYLYLRHESGHTYKATASTLALVTGWGSGGYVSVLGNGNLTSDCMAINSLSQLFVGGMSEAVTSITMWAFDSAGISAWSAVITLGTAIPDINAVVAVNTICIIAPYDAAGGCVIYDAATGVKVGITIPLPWSPVSLCAKSGLSLYYSAARSWTVCAMPISGVSTPEARVSSTDYNGVRTAFLHTNGSLYTAAGPAEVTRYNYRFHGTTLAVQAIGTALATSPAYGLCQTSTGAIIAWHPRSRLLAVLSTNFALEASTVITTFTSANEGYVINLDPYAATLTTPLMAEKMYSRRMVAIAQNRLYYEDSSAQITVLSDSSDKLDTSKRIAACEAFQKVFVANNSVLAVADFAGTKIITQSVGGIVPRGTIISGSDGAEMVVDLVTDATGTCEIYGTRYTVATFTSTDTCTNAALSVSFALAASETAGPHWYNWPVYAGSVTYGSLPDQASLVALYRGRLVLAGNTQYPYQWYMSRVADPWDFEYTAGDPLTAIAGSNADAGALGDIIRALIPYSPDFMIFGCANSMWLLNGDPAAGGSLDEITKDTGIYGPKSWCKDDKGDLYFFGTYGLYHMAGGRGQPSNILSAVWPKLIEDWGLNPNSHRIVMGYDVQRAGVVVCMTNLTDGSNKAFFYHVPTGAVFPEVYHTECAPYSMCAYPSDDAETKGLILGCQDAYLRHFEDGATEDVGSVTTAAVISAYVGWVEKLTEDDDTSMKLNWLFIETGGAISGDTQTDTTSVNMSLYAANDAETCMQKMAIGTVAFLSTSFSGNGRQNKFRQRIKTPYLGVQFATSSAAAYWTINKIVGDVEPSGGI